MKREHDLKVYERALLHPRWIVNAPSGVQIIVKYIRSKSDQVQVGLLCSAQWFVLRIRGKHKALVYIDGQYIDKREERNRDSRPHLTLITNFILRR